VWSGGSPQFSTQVSFGRFLRRMPDQASYVRHRDASDAALRNKRVPEVVERVTLQTSVLAQSRELDG